MNSAPERHSTFPMTLTVALVALGVVLSLGVIPSVFTVDENNYLVNVIALRTGHVTVTNTTGLPPSRELLFFDPNAPTRIVNATPVASTMPPLYAWVALPFSWFGWRGLVALNTCAYLVTIGLVFIYARRGSVQPLTPWLAAAAFAFGGYAIEYALGLWPHALSVCLCTAGIFAAGRAIEIGSLRSAALAGFLIAFATGVRYQNAVILGAVGIAVLLWSSRRWISSTIYGISASVPVAASVVINYFRLASWNPISKGPGYLDVQNSAVRSGIWDPFVMFWARVVDFSVRPPLDGRDVQGWIAHDPTTGASFILGAVLKKALLQSAPWVILALLLFAAAWFPRFQMTVRRRQQVRLLGLVTLAILATFSFSGVARHDGLAFNERYLLELLPLAAVAFAWAAEEFELRPRVVGVGAIVGVALALVMIAWRPPDSEEWGALWVFKQLALLRIPLVLAGALAAMWFLQRSGHDRQVLVNGLAGACLAWGFVQHVTTDVAGSQAYRSRHLLRTTALRRVVPDGSALVTYWGNTEPVGPLLLERDIVVVETQQDDGKDAPLLIRELLARGRQVFVLEDDFDPAVLRKVLAGFDTIPVQEPQTRILAVRLRAG